jgi:fatty-acyl-CoA synthase
MLIADWLAFWRRCEPQRQALFDVARQRSYSYAQLADAADLCALQLQSLGLQQGERIALLAANCPQTLMLLFACARLGVGAGAVELSADAGGVVGHRRGC